MSRTSLALLAGLTALLILRLPLGCSSPSQLGVAADGSEADAGATQFDASADESADAGAQGPTTDLDGWVVEDRYPECPFYYPASVASIPPPVTWEACPPALVPGIACSKIPANRTTGGATMAWVHGDKVTMVVLTCADSKDAFCTDAIFLAQELDGPSLSAFRVTNSTRCFMNVQNVSEGRWVMKVADGRDGGVFSTIGGGIIGGDVGSLRPSLVYKYDAWLDHNQIANASLGILDLDQNYVLRLLPWTNPNEHTAPVVWSGKMDQLLQNQLWSFGDALFWSSNSTSVNRDMIYTSATGVREYLSYGADTTQGAAEFGTDGTDMVWLRGSGGVPTIMGYPTNDIMTASYTKSPPVPPTSFGRRVRSAPANGFGTARFVVGCGHAMRTSGDGVVIVRLSDGVSWNLSNTADWRWASPVALTCAEALIEAGAPKLNYGTLARVRLDSLGPGIAAD